MNLENKKIIELKDYEGEYLYDNRLDKFFENLDEIKSCYESLGFEIPKYLYGTFFEAVSLNLNSILKDACYDHEGDIEDNLIGVEELEKAINKFNEDNTGVGSYYPDFNTLVKLF